MIPYGLVMINPELWIREDMILGIEAVNYGDKIERCMITLVHDVSYRVDTPIAEVIAALHGDDHELR